jgi:AraC-like DNA-binding protein/ligand-binding sensor protein
MNAMPVQLDPASAANPLSALNPPSTGGPNRPNLVPIDFQSTGASPNHPLVEALAASTVFRDYQRAFRDATGLPLTLRPLAGWQLAHQGDRRQNPFCSLMSGTNRACSACLQMQQSICDAAADAPATRKCTFGIYETAVRVQVGQETIGWLQTGQVFFHPPTPRQTLRALKQLDGWGLQLDLPAASRSYAATPVVPQKEYEAKMRLLQFFADQLGTLANQILLHQQNAEPVQITRARQFIESNYKEDLSLAAVARHAGMSSFYFCKTFKKVTGLNYTKYLNRVRVEQAKHLLLNLNYRISEIAYEVGFQSLTHFNRAFRAIAGQSPTEYRGQLAAN